jgi:hypothetical protein
MELWLLGGGAIVLIVLTLWIVWPAQTVEPLGDALHDEEDTLMTPQGDEFEDQYTSATADLSAGGVATAMDAMQEEAETAGAPEPVPSAEPTPYAAAGEPWSSPTIAREGATDVAVTPSAAVGTDQATWSAPGAWSEPQARRALPAQPRTIGIGAAVLLAIASAVLGAWLYARWQRRRNALINRARRGVRRAQKDLTATLRETQKELRSGLHERQKELRSSRFAGAVHL